MLLSIILLIIGFIILIKGADYFVEGASSFASNFNVSKMLIGLTIVSFGTSAPEFAVSITSLLSGNGDIVVGNVVGSNILNILLILGIASMVHFLKVKNSTVKKEIPIIILISALLFVLMNDGLFQKQATNSLTRGDGIAILLFFAIFIYYLFSMMRNKTEEDSAPKYSIMKSIIISILGIGAIILGSKFVVDNAVFIANKIGISERIISLTIVALGTSLPELVTSVVATKKGEYDIAIGNVVGSNIFNIGVVLGLPIALLGGIQNLSFQMIDSIIMLISAILLFIFAHNDYKISKKEGLVFLTIFVIYYTYIVIS